VKLAALVDRGGRQLPIAAQFVGATVAVAAGERLELTRDAAGRLALVMRREKA